METVFYFNQKDFTSRILDGDLHAKLCLTMCIDYIYNRRNNLVCDFLFFTKAYQFSSRQRAFSYGTQCGKIKDAVLTPNGKINSVLNAFIPPPLTKSKTIPYLLTKGDYFITVLNIDDTGHTLALHNQDEPELFDPNKGLFILEYLWELV
ncbi:hypothetical protein LQ294_001464, partial [Escherichia coli]|nr:hypothetical protein [Escherichia coli]